MESLSVCCFNMIENGLQTGWGSGGSDCDDGLHQSSQVSGSSRSELTG
jgi:hypothetical protein